MSGRPEAGEEGEIVSDHRGPDISLEVVEAAPGAAPQSISAFQARDAGLDASAEVSELAIDPAACDHVFDLEAALLVEGHVADAAGFGSAQIFAAGIAAVGRRLTRRLAVKGDVAFQHRQQALAVGRVAGFDDEVEDQSASAGGQIEFMTVVDVAAALDDDVGMRLEQAHQLLASRHRLAGQDPPFGLRDDPLDQRLIVADLRLPEFNRRARRQGQLFTLLLQITQGCPRDLEQCAVVLDPFRAAAGIFDRPSPLLCRAAVVVPWDGATQCIGLLQQPHHHPHGVP